MNHSDPEWRPSEEEVRQGWASLCRKYIPNMKDHGLTTVCPDSNVEKVRELLLERSFQGVKEYGFTTEREDMTELEWHIEHLHELLDASVYVMKKITLLQQKL